MPRCPKCGAEHTVLDPTFRRPEQYIRLDPVLREDHAKADDDLCRITLPHETPQYFVRGTLPVAVAGLPDGVWWGLWAEISEPDFTTVLKLWSEPDQASEPPFPGRLANVIPSYPSTLGLPLQVQLTGPTSRPEFRFCGELEHPFIAECVGGVDTHQVSQWGELIQGKS